MIASKEIRVKLLTIDLMNGQKRADLLAKYGKEWRISARSFDRLLMDANKLAEASLKAVRTEQIEKSKDAIEQK